MPSYTQYCPLISIIIPVFNVEQYIPQCLSSVLRQSYKNLEIICIDDGSTDSSLDILRHYQQTDTRIRVISQTNKGVAAARNLGLNLASGELLIFIDSDDWLDDTFFETIHEFFVDPEINFISFGTKFHYDSAPNLNHESIPFKSITMLSNQDAQIRKLNVAPWSKLYRTDFLKKNCIYFPLNIFYEDTPFHWKCISLSSKILFINVAKYNYRINRKDSLMDLSRQRNKGMAIHILYILDIIFSDWQRSNFLQNNKDLFQYLIEEYMRSAVNFLNPDDGHLFYVKFKEYTKKWGITPRKYTLAYDILNNIPTSIRKHKFFGYIRKKIYKINSYFGIHTRYFPSA